MKEESDRLKTSGFCRDRSPLRSFRELLQLLRLIHTTIWRRTSTLQGILTVLRNFTLRCCYNRSVSVQKHRSCSAYFPLARSGIHVQACRICSLTSVDDEQIKSGAGTASQPKALKVTMQLRCATSEYPPRLQASRGHVSKRPIPDKQSQHPTVCVLAQVSQGIVCG